VERDHQGAPHARVYSRSFYATLHMLTWVVFIHYFDVSFMIEDVLKRPFITVGMATFLMLLVLAITSNKFSIRKLGRKWGKLHRLAYVAAAGGTLHFWQLVKADTTEPWRWAAGFAVLFGFRVWWNYRPRLATAIPNSNAQSQPFPTPNFQEVQG
jgi:sulfoxide reductase heme-binding subunit YedZ